MSRTIHLEKVCPKNFSTLSFVIYLNFLYFVCGFSLFGNFPTLVPSVFAFDQQARMRSKKRLETRDTKLYFFHFRKMSFCSFISLKAIEYRKYSFIF